MKIGRMSAPGTSSNKDMIPTQRNMKRQAIIPTTSRISPTRGISKIATIYSLMSNIIQTIREIDSSSVKITYFGKDLDFLFCRLKRLSSYNNISVLLKKYLEISIEYICVITILILFVVERRAHLGLYGC